MREPNQEITQEIPIEIVEVPPNKTDIPPQTSLRATKDSIAGGKALPEKPVSAMKSVNPTGHKASSESSFDLTPSSPAEVFQPKRQQQKTASPNLSRQQLQLKPRKTGSAPATTAQVPNPKRIAVAPMTTPLPALLEKTAPNLKQTASAPTSTIQVPNFKKIAVALTTTPSPAPLKKTAPLTTPLVSNPKQTASAHTTTVQVPNYRKIAVAPMTTPSPAPLKKTAPLTTSLVSNPKQTASASTTTVQVPNFKKIAVAPTTTPSPAPLKKTAPLTTSLVSNPKQTASAPTTTVQVPNFKKIAVAPMTTQLPAPLGKTALERATTLPVPSNPKNLGQSRTRLNGRTPSQAQSSPKTGAASLLGGTLSVSSQNYHGDDLAALPNSNRDHQATSGIDARSQDIDLTSYLKKLQQRVQQEWLPGLSDSDRRTVLDFTINRSGQVSNLNIAQTSGFSVTDEVALNAIQRAAPFAPLPTGYPKNYINIEFTFDINVYGQLNLWRDGG
ncbi:TonB family protein [Nostoc sp. UHCC 0926]|uniref:TonB family protein n=1 Tax=Nostoc sp. UHCC 0926 TaxID=3025190 RepID=UPI00235DED03|nr:TonB family protein [Nostoc sp. UHCC 0926]